MKREFNAKEKAAIQRYAIEHGLVETKCYHPTVVFKIANTGVPVNVPIRDLMQLDAFDRRQKRLANKKIRAARRRAHEAKL